MKKISRGKKYFIIYIITITVIFIGNYIIRDIVVNNTIKDFNNNKYLLCFTKLNEPTYMINQRDGWSIVNNQYFTKDTILVDMRNCKEQ